MSGRDVVAGRADPPPAANTLGWKLVAIDPASSTIEVAFEAPAAFTNSLGVIQGGFLVAMLDETLGPALVATLPPGQFAPTLELKVNFLRPARPGRLVGTGRIVHRGGMIAFPEGALRDPEDQLVATATATARVVRTDAVNRVGPRPPTAGVRLTFNYRAHERPYATPKSRSGNEKPQATGLR